MDSTRDIVADIKKLYELKVAHSGTNVQAVVVPDRLRSEIVNLTKEISTDNYSAITSAYNGLSSVYGIEVLTVPEMEGDVMLMFKEAELARRFVRVCDVLRKYYGVEEAKRFVQGATGEG